MTSMTHACLAHVLWLQGYPGRAPVLTRAGLKDARDQHGAFNITASMYFLAWLWRSQGRVADARRTLSAAYEFFTEGFETTDLREARELLDRLN